MPVTINGSGPIGGSRLAVANGVIGNVTTLSYSSTLTIDLSTGNNYAVTLTGNATLANPSNPVAGQSGIITITQDGTGSRTLAYGTSWDFSNGTVPTLTTTANAVDVLAYYVISTTQIAARLIPDVK
jgi:hypothetical protein